MPELLEAEAARAFLEARALERRIAAVDAPDAWIVKQGASPAALADALTGRRLLGARRHGKQLLLDTSPPPAHRGPPGPVLGIHLGMSGRIVVDDEAAGDPLVYGANGEDPAWIRFGLRFADGGALALRDPRRLGAVTLDPDEARLGPDAASLRLRDLDAALGARTAPVKAVLLDQHRVAGLGNLLADEALWRAGIDPARPAGDLDADERRRLHRAIRTTVLVLGRRGGSHTGDLQPARTPGASCPRDGVPVLRRTVGGRTTYSCPAHQR